MSRFLGRATLDKVIRRLGGAPRHDPERVFADAKRAFQDERFGTALDGFRSLAESGHVEAQYRLGGMYEKAKGVVQCLPDAVHWYTKAADAGYAPAQAQLGLIYLAEPPAPASLTAEAVDHAKRGALDADSPLMQFFPRGFTVEQDFDAAARWNRVAAEAGHAAAQARLGHQFAIGLGVEKDRAVAERWFTAAAEQGEGAGQSGLGVLYAGGYEDEPDYPQAIKWLAVAAEAGDAVAQYCFGVLLLNGQGIDPTPATAITFFKSAAEQGHTSAMHQLGLAYWRGIGVAADAALAENWLRRAVVADHPDAALSLGQLLLARADDDGIEAAHWIRHAAEQGNTAAASALAQLYLTGHGVPKDRQEATRWLDVAGSEADADALASMATNLSQDGDGDAATEWLRRAAANGSAAACYNLGVLYRSGRSVPKDMTQAIAWHAKAADQGHATAAFALGAIHAAGEEVGQDFVASVYRFRQAADAGHVVARCRLALMTAQGKGVPPAPLEGTRLLEEMVAERIPEAAETLFELYWNGDGVRQDRTAAIGWLERAGELGSATAPRILAEIYDRGEAVPRDVGRIFALLEQASAAGNLEAQTDIARLLLLEGRYGVPDPAEARRWLERAADAGQAEAQSLMGDFCREGLLGPPDLVAAEAWYRRAIANGNSDALLTLAMMLEEAPPDRTESHAEAFALLVVGARSGNRVAQAELAERYRQGIGCSPDEEAASRWLSMAQGRKVPGRKAANLKRASTR